MSMLFANTSKKNDEWIVAVAEFSSNLENDSAAELIARTILQNIPVGTKRMVPVDEQLRQDSYAIEQELLTLYKNLQKKVLERDSVVVNATTPDFEKDIEKKQKEVDAIQSAITEKQRQKEVLQLENYAPLEKNIALWQNSNEKFYDISDGAYINPTDVQALVMGTVEHVDSYIHVSIQLVLFPGEVIVFELRDVENIADIKTFSQFIADEIFVSYSNKKKITLQFAINPPEAQENAVLQINGTPYKLQSNEEFATMNVTEGIYSIYVESPGYTSVGLTQYFGEEDTFNVEISLQKQMATELTIADALTTGELFFNAQKASQDEGTVTINTIPVLGEFINSAGVSTRFILNAEKDFAYLKSPYLSFEINAENPADIIEKKRKIMYDSYSALIVSLPVYFIFNGQYINEYNSCQRGYSSGNSVRGWEMARNASMGLSIGLGVNFLVQLGLYIYSANAILPETITIK